MRDKVLEQVITRLEEWAEWVASGSGLGLGYPRTSLEYRLLRGAYVRQNQGRALLAHHPAAEEMETWIREMASQSPPMAQALRCHYLTGGGLRDEAQKLGISHNHFRMQLAMAQQWLAGRLSATAGGEKSCA